MAPPDPIFGLHYQFLSDTRSNKVDLGAGVYKSETLQPYIFASVKKAEAQLITSQRSKNYLPIDGLREYLNSTQELVFGYRGEEIYGAQTPGGTGALRLGAAFLKELGLKLLVLPLPTWPNHRRIFQHTGLEIGNYTYLEKSGMGIDFSGLLRDFSQLPERSIVLLHACCHNPTGCDLTMEQWEELHTLVRKKNLFPFFDLSYQGFGSQLEEDAFAIRLFLKHQTICAVAVSHSKNFGLYSERCGALFLITETKNEAERVGSNVKPLIRGLYSNPPSHGAHIVATILENSALRAMWEQELKAIKERISTMRAHLISLLHPHFDELGGQQGMFSYTGLSQTQVERLMTEFGIYMPEDGRINVAGLNGENIHYVAQAILNVLEP